jgi:hypothetical protein
VADATMCDPNQHLTCTRLVNLDIVDDHDRPTN